MPTGVSLAFLKTTGHSPSTLFPALFIIKSQNVAFDLSRRPSDPWGNEFAVLLGRSGSSDSEGVTIGTTTTVLREETVTNILERFRQSNPLLIKSPPMSGKTSMATLISHHLKTRATEKCLIINLSMVDLSSRGEGWQFKSAFEEQLGVKWSDLFLIVKNRIVYLIFDEVQVIYQSISRPGSPNNKSECVWNLVKSTSSNRTSNFRILLFSAYGSSQQSSSLSTPVSFTPRSMLGIKWLAFSETELKEFVLRNLDAANILSEASVDLFCINLKRFTGSHCGFCYATLAYLNDVLLASDKKRGTLTADNILRSLDDASVFTRLKSTRAFLSARNVTEDELEVVRMLVFCERMVLQEEAMSENVKMLAQSLVLRGVFVEYGAHYQDFVFSSPVMRRFFTEKVFGIPAARAQENPASLADLVYSIVSSIDYTHIQASLGKTKSTGILLERAWQMEFYRTSFRCTHDFVTSADVGGLFGTRGAIDFTVHSHDKKVFWGIELLREGNRLEDHIERFEDGGRYEVMCRKFTDTCVLDIRREPKGRTPPDLTDLQSFKNLTIFVYNESFSSGVLYSNSWVGGKPVSFST
ncbi:hypothetical protein BDR26DRAFT_852662 [Obelidium mucronatum]|nr:hypothetical protein BDR26DRAFT_852662 [Obelidium mucronatum]